MNELSEVSRFQRGVIEARSFNGSHLHLGVEKYDVAVYFVSWDPRCLNPINANVTSDVSFLLSFIDEGSSGLNARHRSLLWDHAMASSSKVVQIEGDSLDTSGLWAEIEQKFGDVAVEVGRPITVYLDLSAACRYYALALLAACMSGVARRVTVSYSEAHYVPEQSESDRHEMFTLGKWESVPVPGLEGLWDPAQTTTWLVALGFEGSKTFRAVTRNDPDRVRVLLPDPGFEPSYVERTLKNNERLIDEYAVPTGSILRARAADAVAAWQQADSLSQMTDSNVSLVCAGTKPHALGFALHALGKDAPAVLYLKPSRHRETEIRPTDSYWTYEIRDLSLGR